MLNTKFSPWPSFTEEEIQAAAQVLRSNKVNYWTGDECRKFETEFAEWSDSKYAVALSNGTVALEIAMRALGIGPGDEVIVTARSFFASAASVVTCGATPVFADVDRDSGNLSAQTILPAITPRTRAVIAVHLAGWPCDMDEIMKVARAHHLKVIEDCAQAHGARYKNRSVGSIGDVSAWSFCQDKIITTAGEGGMVTTNDRELWSKMWSLKDHGKSYDAVYNRSHPEGFRWVHESFGSNDRMTEVQAAIGRIQLRKMAEWTRVRNENAREISRALAEFAGASGPIRLPAFEFASGPGSENGCVHAQYKLYAYARPENLAPGWTRDRIIQAINEAGVPCYQGACPEIYREKAFENSAYRPAKRLPFCQELGETSLMFLVHPTLKRDEIQKTQNVIQDVLKKASR